MPKVSKVENPKTKAKTEKVPKVRYAQRRRLRRVKCLKLKIGIEDSLAAGCRGDQFDRKRNSLASQEASQVVTPAKAGVQKTLERLDSRLRGNDGKKALYEFLRDRELNEVSYNNIEEHPTTKA